LERHAILFRTFIDIADDHFGTELQSDLRSGKSDCSIRWSICAPAVSARGTILPELPPVITITESLRAVSWLSWMSKNPESGALPIFIKYPNGAIERRTGRNSSQLGRQESRAGNCYYNNSLTLRSEKLPRTVAYITKHACYARRCCARDDASGYFYGKDC
jgi:hypothetical protein